MVQEGEFFGVMRFYYQDDEKKVSTKCIRVSSTAKTMDVLDILIEKFRPDLRMLSPSQYALFEVHSTGGEVLLLFGFNLLIVKRTLMLCCVMGKSK